jgi:hypothetical protein
VFFFLFSLAALTVRTQNTSEMIQLKKLQLEQNILEMQLE